MNRLHDDNVPADRASALEKLHSDLWSFSREVELFAWAADKLFVYEFSYNSPNGNQELAEFGPAILALTSVKCRELSDRLEALTRKEAAR